MPVAKEQIRQIISENNISSVTDVYALLRDSFKDILQELLEAEMDASLVMRKIRKGILKQTIKGTAIPPGHLKASMASSRSMCQVTAMGNSSRSSSQNTSGISPGLRKK